MPNRLSSHAELAAAGYAYTDVTWHQVGVLQGPTGMPRLHAARTHLLQGGELQATFTGAAAAGQADLRYAVRVDLSPGAQAACQGRLDYVMPGNATASAEERVVGIGLAPLARLRHGVVEALIWVALDTTDEGPLLDKLTSALWQWHVEVFGPRVGAQAA
jgi:hypothetical protein